MRYSGIHHEEIVLKNVYASRFVHPLYLVQFQKTCCAMIGGGAQETATRSAQHSHVPLHNNSLGDALARIFIENVLAYVK